jgi:hypothetical protein
LKALSASFEALATSFEVLPFNNSIIGSSSTVLSDSASPNRSLWRIRLFLEIFGFGFFKLRSVNFWKPHPQTRHTTVLLDFIASIRLRSRLHPASTRRCVALTRPRVDLTHWRVVFTCRHVAGHPPPCELLFHRCCYCFVVFLLFSHTFVGVFCTFVCVLLVLFCGLSFVIGFRSSPTNPLRSLAVVLLQQPSPGGCCFYWLGLFESFCHLKPPCAAPGKAWLVYGFSEIIDAYHCLLLLVCVCILLPFSVVVWLVCSLIHIPFPMFE